MSRNKGLDLSDEKLVDQYRYMTHSRITITKHRMDSCLLEVYENGEHLGTVPFGQLAKFAEMDFELSRK